MVSDFTAAALAGLRHAVRAGAARAGLRGDRLEDFIVAVQELATNAVQHGGGFGRLRLRQHDTTLLCEVSDHGRGFTDGIPSAAAHPRPVYPAAAGSGWPVSSATPS
ncbi:ATP-binding protein [Krasilnikovia sp. MM14-A1259]|uniref:ATP-binding protein n=1 Tax=Krasilnikovia sp. MM14-A1259 TaxID=3373539 RepID=UPI003823CDC5